MNKLSNAIKNSLLRISKKRENRSLAISWPEFWMNKRILAEDESVLDYHRNRKLDTDMNKVSHEWKIIESCTECGIRIFPIRVFSKLKKYTKFIIQTSYISNQRFETRIKNVSASKSNRIDHKRTVAKSEFP